MSRQSIFNRQPGDVWPILFTAAALVMGVFGLFNWGGL